MEFIAPQHPEPESSGLGDAAEHDTVAGSENEFGIRRSEREPAPARTRRLPARDASSDLVRRVTEA
jgi:hypothetical protein